MQRRRWIALVSSVALHGELACEPTESDPRTARLVSTLHRADYPSLRARPSLVARKFARMRESRFAFYRGTYPVFTRDAMEGDPRAARTQFAPGALVSGIGDAHPENVGVLLGADETLGLEFNDFDAADRVPYVWDLRRLAAGLCVAAAESNAGDATARETLVAAAPRIAAAAVRAYLDALRSFVQGAPRERITAGADAPNVQDLFRRGLRDQRARAELSELTVVREGQRRLVRGAPDPAAPDERLEDLSTPALESLPALLERYRARLRVAYEPAYFTVLDAARQYGSGVASMPRVRVLVLVRGPTDALEDDVILEVKELGDSGAPGTLAPGVFADHVAERVRSFAYAAWESPEREPLWSTEHWLGMPVQIRAEREAHKSLRVSRMTGALGTPAALTATARVLGALLARVHCASDESRASAAAIVRAVDERGDEAFVSEHVDAALAYARQVSEDHQRFAAALDERGPLLGFIREPGDEPPPDARSIIFAGGVR